MSEQNKAVVRRYVEGLNEENLAVFDEYWLRISPIRAPDSASVAERRR